MPTLPHRKPAVPKYWKTWIAAFALVSLVVAACSSEPSWASTQPSTATSSTPTQGVTSNSIKVGGVEVVNGQGYSYSDVCNGAQVEFDAVNAAGGVNGRKINYTGCLDDGGTTKTDNSQTTRLVEQDKVFAIVPRQSSSAGRQSPNRPTCRTLDGASRHISATTRRALASTAAQDRPTRTGPIRHGPRWSRR